MTNKQKLKSLERQMALIEKNNPQVDFKLASIYISEIEKYKRLAWQHHFLKRKIDEKNAMVKMSICPECGNAIRVVVEDIMITISENEFAAEVIKYDLQVKTISLKEYRSSNIQFYCKDSCSRKWCKDREALC